MTATIPKHRRASRPRRRFRLSSMEVLGFHEIPDVATSWSGNRRATPPIVVPTTTPPSTEPLADWEPTEVGSQMLRGNAHWSLIVGMLLVVIGLVGIGLWLYQQPAELAEGARAGVNAAAEALEPQLRELSDLNGSLLEPAQDSAVITSDLLTINQHARALFEATASLPDSQVVMRTRAADVASDALEASRLLGDASAYRIAVTRILVPPSLETDPALITLEDAALDFGEWQARFEAVRSALPQGTMTAASTELEMISSELGVLQGRYLDALRLDDRSAATSAIEDLAARLEIAEQLLSASLNQVQGKVSERLTEALKGIELLLG